MTKRELKKVGRGCYAEDGQVMEDLQCWAGACSLVVLKRWHIDGWSFVRVWVESKEHDLRWGGILTGHPIHTGGKWQNAPVNKGGKVMKATREAVQKFVERAQEMCRKQHARLYPKLVKNGWLPTLEIMEGQRYYRIVHKDKPSSPSGYAWCFIDKRSGDILKPAGWKGPAKHARGNIFADDGGMGGVSQYGAAYLR